MRVERTLIALGLVLALAGLIVAYNGYIYVNVDRGPPTMVSGVLTFGFGLVIAALGFAVRELQAISADAAKVALLIAKGRRAGYSAESAPHPAGSLQQQPPLAPFEPTPPDFAPNDFAPSDFASKDFSKDFETAPGDVAKDQAESGLASLDVKPEKPRRSLLARKPASRPDEQATPAARSPLSWMAKPDQASETAIKSEDNWLNQAIAAEADKAAREEREIGHGESGSDRQPAQPAPKSDVMGHYEAHGAHYTMFADGSIEAETQHGLYRFANIEELKRFIEGEESGDATAER